MCLRDRSHRKPCTASLQIVPRPVTNVRSPCTWSLCERGMPALARECAFVATLLVPVGPPTHHTQTHCAPLSFPFVLFIILPQPPRSRGCSGALTPSASEAARPAKGGHGHTDAAEGKRRRHSVCTCGRICAAGGNRQEQGCCQAVAGTALQCVGQRLQWQWGQQQGQRGASGWRYQGHEVRSWKLMR
jgi:hypothetical protein